MIASRLDRRLTSRVDPSDVVQETLADASKRMDEYLTQRPLPFLGWLRQLAGERVIDTHRRHIVSQRRSISREDRSGVGTDESSRDHARRFIANDTSPSNRLSRKERRDQVMTAMAELSVRDREVLTMRYFEQLSAAEIAEATGITEGAVKVRLLRADPHAEPAGGVTMTDQSGESLSPHPEPDHKLAELTEEITRRLLAGEAFDAEAYVSQLHECAGPIRELLPTMHQMTEVSRNVARRRQSEPCSDPLNSLTGEDSLP